MSRPYRCCSFSSSPYRTIFVPVMGNASFILKAESLSIAEPSAPDLPYSSSYLGRHFTSLAPRPSPV
jgi:hypothetical protein